MIDQLYGALGRANRIVALILGITLLLAVAFILSDVLMRRSGFGSLGGSDEISGYVMAAVASWGLGCALLQRGHVRIDVIRQRMAQPGRAAMDVLAMMVTNATVLLIAYQCWPVLEKSLDRGSRANTPLETPLWIPQGIWFSGWLWFAVTATLLTLIGLAHIANGRRSAFEAALGIGSELEE